MLELITNIGPGLDIVEVVEKVEGTCSRVEVLLESVIDQVNGLLLNCLHGAFEILVARIPVLLVGWEEDVSEEA